MPAPWKRHLGLYGYRREFLLTVYHPAAHAARNDASASNNCARWNTAIASKWWNSRKTIPSASTTPEDLQRVLSVLEGRSSPNVNDLASHLNLIPESHLEL